MDPCFGIVVCHRLLGFTLNVHNTAGVDTACVLLKIWLIFSSYNSALPCIVELTGHCYVIEILLVVREWEQEGMGITNGNGNKIRLNLGVGMEMGMGLKKTFALISSSQH